MTLYCFDKTKRHSKWMPLVYLALILASFFVAFIVIEVGYRIHALFFRPIIIMTPDGSRFNPNTVGEYRGGQISIDKFGFRNGFDVSAWDKKRKIMLIGDSVGFGMGINDDQTISHRLNEAFSSSKLGFLNLCNPALDTPALRNRLYEHGTSLGPWDLIIWMYYINDAKCSSNYTPLPSNPASRQINWSGRLQYFIYRFFKWPFILKWRIKQLSLKTKEDPRRSSWENYYQWCISSYDMNSKTRENEEKYIRDIVEWVHKNKTRLLFVLCPAEPQFIDGNTKPQDFIKELGIRYDFSVVDLMPSLSNANKKERVFLPDDGAHLNPRGSRIVSEILKDWLISNKYVHRRQNNL